MRIIPTTVEDALSRVVDAPVGILALGIPRCPATILLAPSLEVIAAARPGLPITLGILATATDWASRDELLWPRGIHISRSIVPVVALLRDGHAVATRRGGAPAYVIDEWLTSLIGSGQTPLAGALSDDESAQLALLARRRAQHAAVKGRGSADSGA